jgi:hypothetical protein
MNYTYGDVEGRSNSYHGVNIGLQLQKALPSWVLIGQVSGFHHKYQKTHPLFAKTRQESGISTFAQAMRLNLFGVEDLFASFVAGIFGRTPTLISSTARPSSGLQVLE